MCSVQCAVCSVQCAVCSVQCAVFRLSVLCITGEQFTQAQDSEWQTLFESRPCLKLDGRFNRLGEDDTFLQAGGRIAEYDRNRLLLTVGEHFMDGIHNTDLVQDPSASYGKTWLINRDTGQTKLFTLGHRNP